MKIRLSLLFIVVNLTSQLIAQNTLQISDNQICYEGNVTIISSFTHNEVVSLLWESKNADDQWTSIASLPCEVEEKANSITLKQFSKHGLYSIRCSYQILGEDVDSISNVLEFTVLPLLIAPEITEIDHPICYATPPVQLTIIEPASGGNGNFSYQWQQSSDSLFYQDIAGATGSSYQPPTLTQSVYYRVIATSEYGCGSISSQVSRIEVYPELTISSLLPQTICYNSRPGPLSITAQGGGDLYTYQWQESTDSLNFVDIANANQNNFQPSILTSNRFYRVLVVSQKGCLSVYSNSIKILVYQPFTAGSVSASQVICHNTAPLALKQTSLPSGGDGTYTYQWQESSDNQGFTDISGQAGTEYQPGNLNSTRYYRLKVKSGSGCGELTTSSIEITVLPSLSAATITEISQPICYNTAPSQLSITKPASGGNGNFSYQWQQSSDSLFYQDVAGATGSSYQPPTLTQSVYYRVIATSEYGCGSIASPASKVEVYQKLNPGIIGSTQNICYNTKAGEITFTFEPSGGGNQYSFQWIESLEGIVFYPIEGATSRSYQTPDLSNDRYYKLVVTSVLGCSIDTTNSVKIKVWQPFLAGTIIIGTNKTDSICYNSFPSKMSVEQNCSGGDGQYSYQWQYSTSKDNSNWQDIIGATQIDFNASALYVSTNFRLKFTSGCGVQYSEPVYVVVNPLPSPKKLTGDVNVCANQKDNVYSISNLQEGIRYQWEVQGGLLTLLPNNQIMIDWNKQAGSGTIRLLQTNTLTGCSRDSIYKITISENLSPDRTEIIQKSGSNILICKESKDSIYYNWGYINKLTGSVVYLADSNQRYILLPHNIDTTLYRYFVETTLVYSLQMCVTTSYFYSNKPESSENNELSIQLIPNPVRDVLTIEINNPDTYSNDYFVTISNINGVLVWKDHFVGNEQISLIKLPVQFVKGVYLVQLHSGNKVLTRKLIVE